jgi:hypothetical protein
MAEENTEEGPAMYSEPRRVAQVINPVPVVEGAGVHLRRSIALPQLDYLDPFLLFDHFGSDDPHDYLAGFPMHPHRGIETVTYVLAGLVHHKDSLGNSGSIQSGDIQWMTAGRGIMHEEMPKPLHGQMEGFQLWVNLPAALKMTKPRYQDIPADRIPEIELEGSVKVRIHIFDAGPGHGYCGRSDLYRCFHAPASHLCVPDSEGTHGIRLHFPGPGQVWEHRRKGRDADSLAEPRGV